MSAPSPVPNHQLSIFRRVDFEPVDNRTLHVLHVSQHDRRERESIVVEHRDERPRGEHANLSRAQISQRRRRERERLAGSTAASSDICSTRGSQHDAVQERRRERRAAPYSSNSRRCGRNLQRRRVDLEPVDNHTLRVLHVSRSDSRERESVVVERGDERPRDEDANLSRAQIAQRRRRERERVAGSTAAPSNRPSTQGGQHETVQERRRERRVAPYSINSRTRGRNLQRRTFRSARYVPLASEVDEHYLGAFDLECPSCHALHWLAEKRGQSSSSHPQFAECCRGGEVSLDFVDPIPAELRALYEGHQHRNVEFRRNIRSYNKALAFTPTGGSGRLISNDGRGPPLYKIQGEIYHQIGSILPDDDRRLLYSQMYIYDHEEALQYRMHNNPERDMATMEILQTVLEENHPFVEVYQQAFQLCHTTALTEYRIQLDLRRGTDQRRYNLPSTNNELALIIPGDEDACANSQDIILRPCGGPLVRISECHPAYLTLHFPLLCPMGQMSWQPGIPYVPVARDSPQQMRFVTLCDFAKFRLHPRPDLIESCHLFLAAHLLQEFIVHLWAAAENSQLSWIRHHQANLRAELYQGAVDALHEGVDAASIGTKIILLSSFTGGPRFMHKNLQDTLALLRRFEGSDLFITFTANPQWREVTRR